MSENRVIDSEDREAVAKLLNEDGWLGHADELDHWHLNAIADTILASDWLAEHVAAAVARAELAADLSAGDAIVRANNAEQQRDEALSALAAVTALANQWRHQWHPNSEPKTFDQGVGAMAQDVLAVIAPVSDAVAGACVCEPFDYARNDCPVHSGRAHAALTALIAKVDRLGIRPQFWDIIGRSRPTS